MNDRGEKNKFSQEIIKHTEAVCVSIRQAHQTGGQCVRACMRVWSKTPRRLEWLYDSSHWTRCKLFSDSLKVTDTQGRTPESESRISEASSNLEPGLSAALFLAHGGILSSEGPFMSQKKHLELFGRMLSTAGRWKREVAGDFLRCGICSWTAGCVSTRSLHARNLADLCQHQVFLPWGGCGRSINV